MWGGTRRRNGWRRVGASATVVWLYAVLSGARADLDETVSRREEHGDLAPARVLVEAGRTQAEYEGLLRQAASVGDTPSVAKLITKGYVKDVDARNGLNWTALHIAAYEGHRATVEELLKHGANTQAVDLEGHNALHFAASCRKEFCAPRVAIMNTILGSGARLARAPTASASQPEPRASVAVEDDLAERERQERERGPYHMANRGRSRPQEWSQEDDRSRMLDLVTAADVNGMTPLHFASSRGHTGLVKEILVHFREDTVDPSHESTGAKALFKLLNAETSAGLTPLHFAARKKDHATTRLLLEWGANPTKSCKEGKKPIDITPQDGEVADRVRSLLQESMKSWGGAAAETS